MKRIGAVLLSVSVVLALVSFAPYAGTASHSGAPRATAAAAFINLSGLFGDENEPDENESDDNGSGHRRAARSRGGEHERTLLGVPLDVALPIIGSLLVVALVTALVVRWVRRYRAWKQEVAFRMRAHIRRLSDDFERARRQRAGGGRRRP